MLKTIHVRRREIALIFRHKNLINILDEGSHRIFPWTRGFHVQKIDLTLPEFSHGELKRLIEFEPLLERLHVIEHTDEQRALVWNKGRLLGVYGPGVHAFWREGHEIEIETFLAGDGRVISTGNRLLTSGNLKSPFISFYSIDSHFRGVLFVDGRVSEILEPGQHIFWTPTTSIKALLVDIRERSLDVSGQEMMTADKVSLRLNLLVVYKVVDPILATTASEDSDSALYRDAQLALRAFVGGRDLDGLLEGKAELALQLKAALEKRAEALGLSLVNVGVRDIILPGDMRNLLNQVTEARKAAEANLIRRREETAATRGQANTARLLSDNPVLRRMKELETLQDVLAGTKLTILLNGEKDLLDQIRTKVVGDDAL